MCKVKTRSTTVYMLILNLLVRMTSSVGHLCSNIRNFGLDCFCHAEPMTVCECLRVCFKYVCRKVPSVSPSQENFAYHAEVTKTKPQTAGINSHQQITGWALALFPEICNTLHMAAKCVPDVRGSCVVRAVCTLRSVLRHQKFCSPAFTSPHGRGFFFNVCTFICFFLRWEQSGLFLT